MTARRHKLVDVAREAGVSTATVSRCLNGSGPVSPATRARVMEVVDRLGYIPDLGARALATRRSRIVGAVVPTLENSIFARGLQAFQAELSRLDATLLLASSDYDAAEEMRQIEALVARGVGGLLLIGSARSPDVGAFLQRNGVPSVLAWTMTEDDRVCVGFDNMGASRDLARALIAKGHSRIAMVAGITRDNDRAAGRVEGVRAALAEAGLPPPEVVEAPYGFEAAGDAFERLAPARPSAIVCGNDVQGAGVILRARALGLRVPEDVAVTGFDDIEVSEITTPPLTTVHVPHRRMGSVSARTLVGLMEGREERGERLDTRIVWRGSCP